MAATHDQVSTPAAQGFTDDVSWTHTPIGTPKGVVVIIVQSGSSSFQLNALNPVLYGSVELTLIEFQGNDNLEAGAAYVYFLGAGIPTGPQTVEIDLTGAGSSPKAAYCYSIATDSGDTEVVESGVSNANANPEITLPTVGGFTGMAYGGCFSRFGTVGNLDPGAGYTEAGDVDFGANVGGSIYGAKSGANVLVNWVADDWHAAVGLAVQEVTVVETTSISPLNQRRFQRKTLLRM